MSGPGSVSVDARLGAVGSRIDLDDVHRAYQVGETQVVALDDINLHVDEAAFVVVLGASGSGKTTLLNMIGALDTPTSGTVGINGEDITHASREQRRRVRRGTVSFIFQSFNLFPALTALENVQFGADVGGPGRHLRRGRGDPGRRRPGRAESPLPPPAVRRRAAAGGDRPGPGHRQPDPAGRRADRRAGLPHRRADPRAAPGAGRSGQDGAGRDAQPRDLPGRRPGHRAEQRDGSSATGRRPVAGRTSQTCAGSPMRGLWTRWIARDLRRRWLLVARDLVGDRIGHRHLRRPSSGPAPGGRSPTTPASRRWPSTTCGSR